MINFTLVLKCTDEESNTLDWYLVKQFSTHAALPRVGEKVSIGGGRHTVNDVLHRLDESITEVECLCPLTEACMAYLEEPAGWLIDGAKSFRDSEEQFRRLLQKQSGKSDFQFQFETVDSIGDHHVASSND